MNENLAAQGMRAILHEEIQRLIRDAIKDDGMVRSGFEADRLASVYSGSGFSAAEISEQIIAAAVSAGVALEISWPAGWSQSES